MELWEQLLLGLFALLIIFWFGPGAKRALTESRKAEPGEWKGVLIPIALVVLFVIFLISSVR